MNLILGITTPKCHKCMKEVPKVGSIGGGSAHPGGASASTPGATARFSRRGGESGCHGFRPVGVGSSAHIEDWPGTTA
jgi:hypothetical protein